MIKRLLAVGLMGILLQNTAIAEDNPDTLNLKANMKISAAAFNAHGKRTAVAHVFGDKNWEQWGCGVIKGEDDKYHMFYARWPKKLGHNAWLTHSEIAHAVAEKPEGPYTYVDTALSCNGGDWDQITAHNPKIKHFDGKYYLYYISTHDSGMNASEDKLQKAHSDKGYWKILRFNQRSGVAVSDSLNGPWKRCEKPIIEPSGPIANLTVNPTVTKGSDGKYWMMIKGDKPGSGRQRNQAIAISDVPVGPFVLQPKPAIDGFDTEDADLWYDKNRKRFYALFHMHKNIGLITSPDGLNWTKAKSFKVTPNKTLINAETGKQRRIKRVERPFVLLDENDEPMMIFVTALQGSSYNFVLTLEK